MAEHLTDTDEIRAAVRARYAAAAERVATSAEGGGSCCGPGSAALTDEQEQVFGSSLYDEDSRDELPDTATMASLGCGNPTAVAELHPGETVLDLGSGGGIDVLLSAQRVGPTGRAYGLDMTDEMLALARENQRKAGVENVEWLRGQIEEIPLPAETVDVVISNCVINLSGDKPRVLAEAARVLKPGGRFAVSDVIADEDMDDATRADMQQWTGCIAGALTRREFEQALTAAGLVDVEIVETHRVHDQAASAIVRAHKRAMTDAHLYGPQELYRHWEDQQWSPFAIDLEPDREQWRGLGGEDRGLIYWVLSSLMVAEERITTKFSGLVGAYGSEEEATFLATQQVDEARHMQFYARFQDEVVADPAVIAAHVERAREQISPAFRAIFDGALVEAHERLVANPGDARRQGPLRHPLPPDPRGHARPDLLQLRHRVPAPRGPPAGLRRRLFANPPRRAAPHRLRHLVPA